MVTYGTLKCKENEEVRHWQSCSHKMPYLPWRKVTGKCESATENSDFSWRYWDNLCKESIFKAQPEKEMRVTVMRST